MNFSCIVCNEIKSLDNFYTKDKKTGRKDTTCKECRKIGAKKWHKDNREKSLKNKEKWHKKNRNSNLEKFKENYAKRMEENPAKEYQIRREWSKNNRDKINERFRERYSSDTNFKISTRLRGNTYRIIKQGNKKQCKTLEMLDCEVKFVRKWIESQFDDNMNWENWGSFWHLDHFIPVASFDLTNIENQMKCFHWSNLQPLEFKENLSKNCKQPTKKQIIEHNNKIEIFKNSVKKHPKSV